MGASSFDLAEVEAFFRRYPACQGGRKNPGGLGFGRRRLGGRGGAPFGSRHLAHVGRL